MTKTDNLNEIGVHVFERAGLGIAPYEFLGVQKMAYQACQGAPVQPGTSCHYCGMGIMYAYQLKSSDGKKFHVGCDCIAKSGDAGLIKAYKTSRAHRDLERQKRQAKDAANQAEISKLLAEKREALSAKTIKTWNGAEESFYSYLLRVLPSCGAAGRQRYLRQMRAA